MELGETILEALQAIGECGLLQQLEIEEARYIAACVELDDALEAGADPREMARHCRKILRLGERVCSRKSTISITPRLVGIYDELRQQADRGAWVGLPPN